MAANVKVALLGDARSLNKAFDSAGVHAKRFDRQASKTRRIAGTAFKAIGLAGAVGAGLIIKGLKDSVAAAMEEQKVQAQTAAVLKSTGGVAKISAKELEAHAGSLAQLTGTDDEAIQSMENLLLTFTKIRNETGKGNDIFNQATRTALNMSAALGQDLKSSAIQLGKALGDPVRGMTALRRVGVTFTDAQADQVKKLVATGHLLKAQKLILKELRTEFAGSAKAAGQTFGGQMNRLRVNIENLQERIGKLLLPVLTRWARKINEWLAQAKNQRRVLRDIRSAVKFMVGAMKVAIVIGRVLANVFQRLANNGRRDIKIIRGIVGAFKDAWASVKKNTMAFYTWLRVMGLKIALAIIEPFSHIPKRLGGGRFQKMKEALSKELNEIVGLGKADAAKTTGSGMVRSPIRGGSRGRGGVVLQGTNVHHHHLVIDGREVASVVTKHQARHDKHNSAQRTGRHPGRTR